MLAMALLLPGGLLGGLGLAFQWILSLLVFRVLPLDVPKKHFGDNPLVVAALAVLSEGESKSKVESESESESEVESICMCTEPSTCFLWHKAQQWQQFAL